MNRNAEAEEPSIDRTTCQDDSLNASHGLLVPARDEVIARERDA
ncbi:MAG: hypothetical protein WAT25_00100 [Paracoccaceae bacterium]|jgi:hypothetical protein